MVYEFDRYVNGRLMAEGCRITRANSWVEALEKAKDLYAANAKPGEMERTKFVPRDSVGQSARQKQED